MTEDIRVNLKLLAAFAGVLIFIAGLFLQRERELVTAMGTLEHIANQLVSIKKDAQHANEALSSTIHNAAQSMEGMRSRLKTNEERQQALDMRIFTIEKDLRELKENAIRRWREDQGSNNN